MWRRSVALFRCGLVAGALTTGSFAAIVAGLLSPLPLRAREVVAAVTVAAGVVLEIAGAGDRLPQRRRLVPQSITLGAQRSAALQFGFEMGTGVRTLSPSAIPIVTVATLALVGSWSASIVVALAFAVGRAVAPAARARTGLGFGWDDGWSHHRAVIGVMFGAALASVGAQLLRSLTA